MLKAILQIGLKKIFVIKEIINTAPWTYVINNLNGEEIIGTFYEKELKKIDQQEFRIEKLINKKENKLYVKWKGYDSIFNSWNNKRDLYMSINESILS